MRRLVHQQWLNHTHNAIPSAGHILYTRLVTRDLSFDESKTRDVLMQASKQARKYVATAASGL